MPWERFYNRSLYGDMSGSRPHDDRNRCRLRHQSIRDLFKWKSLTAQELSGRPMVPTHPTAAIHTNAADLGFGATLNTQDLRPEIPGQWAEQGVWSWQDRAESISYGKVKAVRMALTGAIGRQVLLQGRKDLMLHIDNQV